MSISFVCVRHSKVKVIYISWQPSYFVIGNVFYCSIWHLLTPFLKNLEMKVSHSCLPGTKPSENKFLEKPPQNSGSSLFSASKGSFKVKRNSSFHDSFSAERD